MRLAGQDGVTPIPTPVQTTNQVRPFELAKTLSALSGRVKVLSLDCFDTLLWRRTAMPSDVFFDLERRPPFARLGFTARLRAQAEATARGLRRVRQANGEIRLGEIYLAGYPALTPEALTELAEAEIAAEMEALYAFPPVVELIRLAKAAGKKVILVSDIYFDEAQLRRLLGHALPADVLCAIDRVYVSSEHRMGKCDGLFEKVLADLNVEPASVLHIGDNPHADYLAPRTLGIHAIQLVQNDVATTEVLRLQGTALALLDPATRKDASMPSPFHGVLAERPSPDEAAHRLGYAAAGPIFYAFGRMVLDELEAMRAAGTSPKPLFLMRDAHLPQRVVNAIAGADVGHAVSVSRFSAIAASFRTLDDLDRYLSRFAGSKRFEDLARQLLLPEKLARDIIGAANRKNRPVEEFMRRVRRPDVVETIVARSRAYLGRLARYLEKVAGVRRGDSIVLVDLGYEGTAQRLLEPIFAAELGIEMRGLYLLVVGTHGWERSRKGLIDPSWCDERAGLALVDQIALVEDICTADMDSVVDYSADGDPIFTTSSIPREQIERVKPVQDACVAFAGHAEAFFAQIGHADPVALRRAALGQLGRLAYFPTRDEMTYVEGFHLDMNLATSDSFRLFDHEAGLRGLRRRGLFFMEMNLKARRMNYPIELRYAGIELAVTYFAQQRYQLGFAHSDFTVRREPVSAILVKDGKSSEVTVEAYATHDGYFALHVPVGEGEIAAAVLFGKSHGWVQMESIELIATHAMYKDHESHKTEDIYAKVVFDGMVERGPRLFECTSDAAFLYLPAGMTKKPDGRLACRIVYRSVAPRAARTAQHKLAAAG